MNFLLRTPTAGIRSRQAAAVIITLLLSAPSLAQTANVTKLFPSATDPQKETATLTSRDLRVGNKLYQVFTRRAKPHNEAFRVDVGFYDEGQLVSDWAYGVTLDKDMNGDGTPDYVWYGYDDAGLRLLWFLSSGDRYDCVNVFKTAERAWTKRFAQPAPDLEEAYGDDAVAEVTWVGNTRVLSILVELNWRDPANVRKVPLRIAPADFVRGAR